MPWHRGAKSAGAFGRPHNPVSKHVYQGSNVLQLWCAQDAFGYATPAWATYKQWQSVDAQVRKGEKGTPIIFMRRMERETVGDDGETETESYLIARASYVFNAAQVDGYAAPAEPSKPSLSECIERADAFVAGTDAIVRHGGERAFYSPSSDHIQMPERGTFRDTSTRTASEGYYGVLLHELTHWTGHEKRCAREFGKRFGDNAYAVEELVAELGASFLSADLGVTNEPRPDHARYVASWLEVLKGDSRAIFHASAKAESAVAFLHGLHDQTDKLAA
jgi:antirestriction protein ArdC